MQQASQPALSRSAIQCPACLAAEAHFAFEKNRHELFLCSQCGFLFVQPFPSEDEIGAYYRSHYRGATPDFYPKSSSRRRRAFARALRYFSYAFRRDVLDLGCGGGFMAGAFARFAASAAGLDISENSIAYARKHFPQCRFYCENFATFRSRNISFDFVFSSELLEHLPGAEDFMRTLEQITRPGGHVYISAPDTGHPKTPIPLESWGDICPPEHLEFFNARNLDLLFARHGFTVKKRLSSKSPAHSVIYQKTAAPQSGR